MPDEVGTEATRSDAPSADDSLFGDKADDTPATAAEEKDSDDAVADGQDSNEESAQDPQGARATPMSRGPLKRRPATAEDLKVVVSIKGGRASIGVQQPSSDPHIETFDDLDVSGLTQEVSAVVERARARWEDDAQASRLRRDPLHRPDAGHRRGQGAAQAERQPKRRRRRRQQQPETLRLF